MIVWKREQEYLGNQSFNTHLKFYSLPLMVLEDIIFLDERSPCAVLESNPVWQESFECPNTLRC